MRQTVSPGDVASPSPFLGCLPKPQRPALIGACLLIGLANLLELREEVEARGK